MTKQKAYFTPALFSFFEKLKANNAKDWFESHRDDYEDHVKQPAMEFIRDMAPLIAKISANFVADPKKSMFRIHRDTRFSTDKSPYKTHLGIQFRHSTGKDVHAPGFYVHLEPGEVFVGMGIWHPDPRTAAAVRDAIVEDPTAWKRASMARGFLAVFSPGGDSLKRPPRGYDPNHPLVEDLMRKDFFVGQSLRQSDATSSRFLSDVARAFQLGAPYMKFLCSAVGVPF
ncbi:MAG: DUF2461 domain-containing protein [Polyangia bacterium]|jgi:uncharacterized protein (TIGR02453 family)|nr:DUF2461 domain-containing protein [Polyangia bacterium]